jgi:hypothetical protein
MIGRLTGTVATARTPSAATDNWLHSYGEVASSLELATRLVRLATAVVRTLEVNRERLALSAADQQTVSTDIADELVLRAGLDYRTAYRIVGRAVATALSTATPISMSALNQASLDISGEPLPASAESLNLADVLDVDALDPVYAPGTGTPEIGGLSTREALAILHGLKGLNVCGGDVVEVAPQYDASTNTAQAGAQMLFEILSLMAFSPACKP